MGRHAFKNLVDVIGLEPTTPSMSRRYSNQLSYTSVCANYNKEKSDCNIKYLPV